MTLPASKPWFATHIRRWHANPALCHTVDPISSHSGRMGVLALHLWGAGCSRALLVACLCHDLGESATGDVPWPAKQDPTFRAMLEAMEARALRAMGMQYEVSADDQRRLKYLDRLDAYLWVQHHAPHELAHDDWPEKREWLLTEAEELGAARFFGEVR